MTTKEEILANVRKSYSFFECPTRANRINCPEDIWQSIEWTDEEIEINCALPLHMWGWRQDDRPWPMCRQVRGANAIGPRAKELGVDAKFKATPPKLVKGRGISRWMSVGDASVLEIPIFSNYEKLWTPNNLPEEIVAIERQGNLENTGKPMVISKTFLLQNYGPTSLQKFSDRSYLVREPYHISWHKMIKRREILGKPKDKTGPDIVAFSRYGDRWDSLDNYYVKKAFYAGLAWN